MNNKLKKFVAGLIVVKPEEFQSLLWSFLYFFSLLAAYFILRPVRDAMGIIGGVDDLPWLFTGTFVTMLALSPLFAWLVSKFPKKVFLPATYGFFILNILIFWILFSFEETLVEAAMVFFIWSSLFNLFVVSVFWSFMVDLFEKGQAKRLFGFIAAGGTLGTIAGSGITIGFSELFGETNLLLLSALVLSFSLFCIRRLLKIKYPAHKAGKDLFQLIGGKFYSGYRDIIGNKYLLGISGYIGLFTLTSTFLYFQQAEIVSGLFETSEDRTQVFAFINLSVSVLTILTQVFVTTRFVRRFGIKPTVTFLPLVTFAGFLLFAFLPGLTVLVVFQVFRRTSNFAISRPGREMLFSVISVEQKYKAKNVIDTVVYRGGDALSGWLYTALASFFGMTIPTISLIALPAALAWIALGWSLGKTYDNTHHVDLKPKEIQNEKAIA